MKRIELTSEWLENWKPKRKDEEVTDRGCKGLVLRGGPSGSKTFYRWTDATDEATGKTKRKRVKLGHWPTLSLGAARKAVHEAREARLADAAGAVGDLLNAFVERGQASEYTAAVLRKHLAPLRDAVAATLQPDVLPDLVAKVQRGYEDDEGRVVGGPAVADKVRGGLRSLFAWAQRQGKYPADRPLPTLGLVREDFKGIGWKPRERVPSERELHALFDALGIGSGPELAIDLKVNPRVPLATRLAVLALLHVPVRSGVGLLAQPASAADLKAGVLRWQTNKGGRSETLETPLSTAAVQIVERLRALPGGDKWLVPSPDDPGPDKEREPLDVKTLARLFKRLQSPGKRGKPARVTPDEGADPFTPHCLRAAWTTLAGDLGIHDGVAVRVIGHKPEGASAAHGFYDFSKRQDLQREAVERVSGEIERIRRRKPRKAGAPVVPLAERRQGQGVA